MMADWRAAFTFSDRLDASANIAAAYQSVHPACTRSEAFAYARASEETARKDAQSREEYHGLCANAVRILDSQAPSRPPVPEHEHKQEHEHKHHDHVDRHIVPQPSRSGGTMGHYTNVEHFSDGLFSEVFRAVDLRVSASNASSKLVALKITNPSMEQPPHDSKREARILGVVKDAHIIPLIETFTQPGGRLVLVFPYMPYDLNRLLHTRQITVESRRPILIHLFSALAHIHRLGIVHRDVKPSNILLATPNGPAYLADFGIAWAPNGSASEPADDKILDVGTTSYRPPELLFGSSDYGEKVDMWAAGCVAAQVLCLNGNTLFDAGDLGSDLALIKSIFSTLGTPDINIWPEAARLPDWGKMNFTRYPAKDWEEILPGAETSQRKLVKSLVQYESAWRLSAEEALQHPYLQ